MEKLMIQKLWDRFIEPRVQGAITRRILAFHDAMIARGQIVQPPVAKGPKVTVCYTEADSCAEGQSQHQAETVFRPSLS